MSKKILIIEDDKFLRELVVKKLTENNFLVFQAIDGKDGLRKMKEEKPDLVLLDLILPNIDGFEVLAQAKKDPEISKIPIIVLSNLGQEEEIEKGLQLGAIDYLVKANFTLGEIVEKIKNILKCN